ncbi:methyl-accepting chemotaxis protein [Acinetobacter baumannii]|uniref:methyl-accepting chemotaxis protein n=1 Tax=Acinetobacter baumannii TaxID=470 RepID=UPI0024B73D58|nr:methyl-accepting chemotaxis protein [Acinetobacter baumannii]MDI9760570.1 methyl-accepting chemotaxis protein [Acinetobacter baumannii]
MRNLKYLIFIIISLFSVQAFAGLIWRTGNLPSSDASTSTASCKAFITYLNDKKDGSTYGYRSTDDDARVCYYSIYPGGYQGTATMTTRNAAECPQSGYPVPVYFAPNTAIPLRVCKQNSDGTYCVYDAPDKSNPIVITSGEYQNITLRSVSEIPSPSCTPEFSKTSCDPKDPYGGCYQPPDDGCNRMADGSIYCPEGTPPPPIQSGCSNNATYCDMPPTGCGSGYVPGTFNGQQICVRKSNPPPIDPIDQPPSASEPPPIDPNDPPPTSAPPPIPNESNTILRSILDAINAVNNKLTWLKDEIVNSVNNVSRTLGITNQKLDAVNSSVKETTAAVKQTTTAVNNVKAAVDANATTVKTAVEANADKVKGAVDANTNSTANKLNEVVNAINNKPVGGGGSAPDMKPTNDLLTEIKNFMKEGPDKLENEKPLEVKNENVTDYDRQNHVVFGQYCPFSPEQTALPVAPGYEMTVSSDLTPICTFGEKARPIIQLIGHLGALLFVLAALRSKD